jgi:hypothetical protein
LEVHNHKFARPHLLIRTISHFFCLQIEQTKGKRRLKFQLAFLSGQSKFKEKKK